MYCINYAVKQGDTLYKLSRHFNVGIREIMDANPLINVYNLIEGKTICIPVSGPNKKYTNFTTYLVKDGDTLGSILGSNEIKLSDLLQFNDLKDIYLEPGSTLKVPILPGKESGVTL